MVKRPGGGHMLPAVLANSRPRAKNIVEMLTHFFWPWTLSAHAGIGSSAKMD